MNSTEILSKAIDVCEDRKAEDLVAYDLQEKSILADYYLLCSGNSIAQIRAIVQHLERSFKDLQMLPRSIEGIPESKWVILDYNDIVIHIFHHEIRAHYDLEGLLDPSTRCYVGDNVK